MKDVKIILVFIWSFVLSCSSVHENIKEDKTVVTEEQNLSPKVEARIFRNDTIRSSNLNGFGYDILVDGKTYIHQPHVPAVSGSTGFASEEDARRMAEYVMKKLQETHTLPAVSKQELDSLGIKY